MPATELMELDITIGYDIGGADECYCAGWEDNGVFVTLDSDVDPITGERWEPVGYAVSRQWLAGTTAAMDDERDESMRHLALEAAIALANQLAEERRSEVLAEMEADAN